VGLVGLQGVTLSGLPGSPVTNSNGDYTATVASGFSGTVTPTMNGYAFTPASRTYTNVTVNQTAQNYSGALQSFTISGRVTVGVVGLQGVTFSGLPGSPVTDVNGNYSATVASGFSATVTPAMNGYAFTPANRTYTSVASNQAAQDYSGTDAACPTWYHDADGDGYGNPADSLVSCTKPSGYVSDNTDCNDQNAAIHPGATEICGNGIDDDCTGGDTPCSGTWYRDADGDGYGNPAVSTTSVSPPAGYVSDHTDCNDNRSDVHPGLAEVCGDGVDNNCNGQVDEGCANSSPPPTDTDRDGVPDGTDVCPGTAAGAAVDAKGCSAGQRDSDGDGVTDTLDQCPGTPTGAQVDAGGCLVLAYSGASQLDDDADGVPNAADRCPGTAAGTAVDNEGCALKTAGNAPTPSAAGCGGGAAVGMVGIMTGLSLMQRRRPRRL
jgi:Putative metal-binding motif/Thrombospondin type 3 repeat